MGGDFEAVPQLPQYPLNIENGHLDPGSGGNLGSFGQAPVDGLKPGEATFGSFKVPVNFFGAEGSDVNTAYPSFSYNVIDVKPRFSEYIVPTKEYGGENYVIPVGAEETIDDYGTEATRAPLAKTRTLEHGYDFTVEIRVLCKDEILAALLVEHVFRVLPPRTFLRVPQKDGTYRSWDVSFLAYQNLDDREAVRAGLPGAEREYSRVLTYVVQGYADETDLFTYINIANRRRVVLTKA